MAVPKLGLDRPFTYVLNEAAEAGTGSLVSVPFHGRTVKGWILGPASEVPPGRLLPIRKVRSSVRFFDEPMLRLLRWVSERYIAPLSTVIERSHPPRVAGEESRSAHRRAAGEGPAEPPTREAGGLPRVDSGRARSADVLAKYGGARILEPGRPTWLRPLPREEVDVCVAGVESCLASGRSALVLVPEADPIPATGRAVLEAFGERAISFLGGDGRDRYRTWLDIQGGRFDVVVGTRPAVFAPLAGLGLIWLSREVHPGHREDRSPYYHVREVASARTRFADAACVLASLAPSVETAAGAAGGTVHVARPPRAHERRAAPLVETSPPDAHDRSARLGKLLGRPGPAALIVSRTGFGVARVCRSCGEPARCARCSGPIVVVHGESACRVCAAPGVCANCGSRRFGVERSGTESVAEWAGRIAGRPVDVEPAAGPEAAFRAGRVVVGTAAAVKDVGPQHLNLVALLDPDRSLVRAGIHAGERALATWMEAAAWAAPSDGGTGPAAGDSWGRVLAQTRHGAHPSLQALIRWEPLPFLLSEAGRRATAGFPPSHPVFRVEGSAELTEALEAANGQRESILTTTAEGRTVCLVAVPPAKLAAFRQAVLRLVAEGTIDRVEAEPQL